MDGQDIDGASEPTCKQIKLYTQPLLGNNLHTLWKHMKGHGLCLFISLFSQQIQYDGLVYRNPTNADVNCIIKVIGTLHEVYPKQGQQANSLMNQMFNFEGNNY